MPTAFVVGTLSSLHCWRDIPGCAKRQNLTRNSWYQPIDRILHTWTCTDRCDILVPPYDPACHTSRVRMRCIRRLASGSTSTYHDSFLSLFSEHSVPRHGPNFHVTFARDYPSTSCVNYCTSIYTIHYYRTRMEYRYDAADWAHFSQNKSAPADAHQDMIWLKKKVMLLQLVELIFLTRQQEDQEEPRIIPLQ